MSTPKTCEEYVLAKLNATELELESIKTQYEKQKGILDVLTKEMRIVKSASDDTHYIATDNIWERYDKGEYDFLISTLDLKEEDN